MDGISSWEVAWHRAEASQVADVLEIVHCGHPRGKRQLRAQRNTRLVGGAGPELVVWLRSFLLEAGVSSLPLLFAAPVGSGLDRELGLTEPGHCVLPHKSCTVQAVCVAAAATAAGVSSLQQIEGLTLATKMGVARLWQVPGAVYHVLTFRKTDLVQIVWRRPPRGETIQPVSPAPSESALLAVLGWIPRVRLWGNLAHEGSWLFFGLTDFLLFSRGMGRGQLFLEGDGFLRKRRIHFLSNREVGREQLFLDWYGFWRGRGLYFPLSLKRKVMLRRVKVIHREASGLRWGRGCCIANFLKVLWSQLLLPWSLVTSLRSGRGDSQIG